MPVLAIELLHLQEAANKAEAARLQHLEASIATAKADLVADQDKAAAMLEEAHCKQQSAEAFKVHLEVGHWAGTPRPHARLPRQLHHLLWLSELFMVPTQASWVQTPPLHHAWLPRAVLNAFLIWYAQSWT